MNLLNLFMVKKKLKKHRLHQETFFAGGGVTGDIPTTTYAKADLDEGKDILTLLG